MGKETGVAVGPSAAGGWSGLWESPQARTPPNSTARLFPASSLVRPLPCCSWGWMGPGLHPLLPSAPSRRSSGEAEPSGFAELQSVSVGTPQLPDSASECITHSRRLPRLEVVPFNPSPHPHHCPVTGLSLDLVGEMHPVIY